VLVLLAGGVAVYVAGNPVVYCMLHTPGQDDTHTCKEDMKTCIAYAMAKLLIQGRLAPDP